MTLTQWFYRIVRCVILYGLFIVLSLLSSALFQVGLIEQLRANIEEYVPLITDVGATVFSFFTFASCLRRFSYNDVSLYRAFSEVDASSAATLKSELSSTLKNPLFITESAVLSAFILLLPAPAGWAHLMNLFAVYAALRPSVARLLYCVILVTYCLICNTLAHLSARKAWRTVRRAPEVRRGIVSGRKSVGKSAPSIQHLVKTCVATVAAYSVCALVCAMAVIILCGAALLIHMVIRWQFFAVVLCLLLLLSLHRYWRALRVRIKFRRRLLKVCRESHYRCSAIRHLFTSVFSGTICCTFVIEIGYTAYHCRLVGAVRPKNRILLSESGCLHEFVFRLMKRPIFRSYVGAEYDFPVDGKHIVIVAPTPDNLMIHTDTVVREAHTGDKIGSYRVYFIRDFLGSLERDCLQS